MSLPQAEGDPARLLLRRRRARPAGSLVRAAPSRDCSSGPLGSLRRVGTRLLGLPRAWAWLPVLTWGALIWIASSHQPGAMTETIHWTNLATNTAHAPEFGLLALAACLALPRTGGWVRFGRGGSLAVMFFVLGYAALDELHQSRVPGRDASVLDVATDLVGAACVLWVAAYAGRPRATGRGLVWRLAAGVALAISAGSLATYVPPWFPDVSLL